VKAQVLAGRLEEAYVLAERALALTHERQERGNQAYVLCLSATLQRGANSRNYFGGSPLPPGPRLGRRTRHAPVPGPLPPGSRHAVCHDRPAGAAHNALVTAIALYRSMAMTFWLPQTEAALAQVEER